MSFDHESHRIYVRQEEQRRNDMFGWPSRGDMLYARTRDRCIEIECSHFDGDMCRRGDCEIDWDKAETRVLRDTDGDIVQYTTVIPGLFTKSQ